MGGVRVRWGMASLWTESERALYLGEHCGAGRLHLHSSGHRTLSPHASSSHVLLPSEPHGNSGLGALTGFADVAKR